MKQYRSFKYSEMPKEYQAHYTYRDEHTWPVPEVPGVFNIADEDELSWPEDELCEHYRALSLWLISQGCNPGDRVVIE